MRAARRTAERAAREALATTMVGSVGDLGEAAAARLDLADAVTAAQQKKAEMVEAARREAGVLVEAARARVRDGEAAYEQAWAAACRSGWTPAALKQMGYQPPARQRDRSAPASGAEPTAAGGGREVAGEDPQPAPQVPAADHTRAAVPDPKTSAT
jgi:hypothetical protein